MVSDPPPPPRGVDWPVGDFSIARWAGIGLWLGVSYLNIDIRNIVKKGWLHCFAQARFVSQSILLNFKSVFNILLSSLYTRYKSGVQRIGAWLVILKVYKNCIPSEPIIMLSKVDACYCIRHSSKESFNLKPQDSFGEFDNSWSSESAGNHQKTPSDLPAIVLNDFCNAILPSGKLSLCITYGKVFGGTPNMFMFWLFSEAFRSELLIGH